MIKNRNLRLKYRKDGNKRNFYVNLDLKYGLGWNSIAC